MLSRRLRKKEYEVEAAGLGANDYITKPVDFPVAEARIEAQLARWPDFATQRSRDPQRALHSEPSPQYEELCPNLC